MRIETKYNIGDEVWTTNFGVPLRGMVTEISISVIRNRVVLLYIVCFEGRHIAVTESSLSQTKEELLKSL